MEELTNQNRNNKLNEKLFNKWITLREQYRYSKKDKDYNTIISISEQIIELDKTAKFIKIMVPLFHKDIGEANMKKGNTEEGKKSFQLAVDGFKQYRNDNRLNKPDDWLKDIEKLERKIKKIDEL